MSRLVRLGSRQGTGVDAVLTTTFASDDIVALRDALRGALGTVWQELPSTVETTWRERWEPLAELGLPGFCVPEARGGFGLRVDAAVTAAMELGAALHPSPFAGLTASAHALAEAAEAAGSSGDPVVGGLLDDIAAGARICAFGRLGPDGRTARLVDGGPDADALLLLDRTRDELLLLAGPGDWSGEPSRHGFDITRTCADVTVTAGRGQRIAAPVHADALYELLLAADAIGGTQRALDHTVAYTGQRQAFGRPIGGFQAVQHRLADHAVRVRGMALLVHEAARQFDAEPRSQEQALAQAQRVRRAVALASLSVSSGAGHILHDLLQLTGAIGFTWEYGLHLYQRRVHQDARLAANPRAAARSLADTEGWTDAH
ncbi:acyl-CoA dehydrogenase family protein [Parafrankia sp. EUN1f]|uniref:acyl-CoA dehydrogenase family protein n=1 Tax=Parafrankia sp. EUN1f TaxID=102897 RepID=UPI0012FB35F9|nr:acyl-CoA dehydrogenase family protein [Parafrankia sp. EUN1f]